MEFNSPLVKGTLVQRYKRFLADVTLASGELITASVPNTGSMLGLSNPGSPVWLSVHNSTTRKYKYALELVEADGTIVGINTSLPNTIAVEAIQSGMIADLRNYQSLKKEQKYGTNSRIDVLLEDPELGTAYVEVKNVHLVRQSGLAEFPDSVTTRGAKHLAELAKVVEQGHRGVMIYLIQRSDCEAFQLCRDMDPNYCSAFDLAIAAGVEAYAIRCQISRSGITADALVPINEPVVMSFENEQDKAG